MRNLLLHLAVEGLYQPLWSDEIMDEVRRALAENAGVSEEQWAHLLDQMTKHFPTRSGAATPARRSGSSFRTRTTGT